MKTEDLISALTPGATMIYIVAILLGLYVQFQTARTNGRTAAAMFWDYWLKETPGMSIATAVVLVTVAGATIESGVLDGMKSWSVFSLGFLKGFGFDALIQEKSVGAPKQSGFMRLELAAFLATAAIAIAMIGGCGVFGDGKPVVAGAPASCKATDPATKAVKVDPICAEAFDLINQANVLLIAVDRAVTDRVNSKIWTLDQALPYFQKTSHAGQQLDQAQMLFSSGTYTAAKTQADATKALLLLLQKEIAAAAAKSAGAAPPGVSI